MQFKPPLCWQVSGQELSQRKRHTRKFVFSKLFLELPKMVPGQPQVVGPYADEHGGHGGKTAKQAQPLKKVLTPPIITLLKTLHGRWGNLTCLPSFSPDPPMKPTPGWKCSDQTPVSSDFQGDICCS